MTTTTAGSLPVTLRLGAVHLTVSDLQRSIDWYERVLGLRVRAWDDGYAELGDGRATLLVLREAPGAVAPAQDEAAMFHWCLLYETREELARASRRIADAGAPITNQNDRHTHEAIYLDDPDGINVELAWDRPRDQWPETPYGRTPVELDEAGLLATIAGEGPSPQVADGAAVGHVHFTVGGVAEAVGFYRDELGLDLKYDVGHTAFFSVGGYHHQIAANTRRGPGVRPHPRGALGFGHWTIRLSGDDEVAAVRERLEAHGRATEDIPGGFAVDDPWELRLHVVG